MKNLATKLKISHVWLYVKNTSVSIRFYRDVIGLKVTETFPDGVLFGAGNVLLGIHREEGIRKSRPGGTVIILQTDKIEEDYETLKNMGVVFETPIKKEPYGKIASFKDPDGYILELVQETEFNSLEHD